MAKICEDVSAKPKFVEGKLRLILRSLSEWLESLRSTVSGEAIECFGKLCSGLGSKMVINKTLLQLLRLAANGDKGFLARKALSTAKLAAEKVSARRVALLLARQYASFARQSALKEVMTAVLLHALGLHDQKQSKEGGGGDWGIESRDMKKLLHVLSDAVQCGSLAVRQNGQRLLEIFQRSLGSDGLVQLSLRAHSMDAHLAFVHKMKIADGKGLQARKDTPRPKSRYKPRVGTPRKRGGVADTRRFSCTSEQSTSSRGSRGRGRGRGKADTRKRGLDTKRPKAAWGAKGATENNNSAEGNGRRTSQRLSRAHSSSSTARGEGADRWRQSISSVVSQGTVVTANSDKSNPSNRTLFRPRSSVSSRVSGISSASSGSVEGKSKAENKASRWISSRSDR
jgi:hypothetical protein